MRLFNNGAWTQARFNSFVKSALRAASRRWPPKYECLNDAFVDSRMNEATGRVGKHCLCAICKGVFPTSKVQVDHINPIVDPVIGFVDWDTVIDRLFCEKANLQCVCIECHKVKSATEKGQRKGKNATRD